MGRRWGVADAGVLRAWDGGTGGGQGGRMHVEFKRGVGRVVHGVLKIENCLQSRVAQHCHWSGRWIDRSIALKTTNQAIVIGVDH